MIKDSEMPLEKMQKLIGRGCECRCGGPLSIAWGGAFKYAGFILRCGEDITHTDFERPHELSLGSNSDLPGWKLSKKRRMQLEKQVGTTRTHALMRYQGVAALTKPEITDIISTIWPRASTESPTTVKKAILICLQYHLNPLMNHLALMPFRSKKTGKVTWAIALTIKSNRILAHRQGRFSYFDNSPRYMTNDEQAAIRGKVDEDNIWFITKLRDERGNEAQGYGSWPKNVQPMGAEKGNTKENQAAIRSERQALDRLFPEALPQGTATVDESQIEAARERPAQIEAEVIEGEAMELEEDLDELPEGDEKAAEPGQTAERAAGGSETDLSSQKGKGQKPRGVSAATESPRDLDIRMARGAAGKLKWDNARLMKELQDRTKYTRFEDTPDHELHDFASKLVDLAECA